MSVVPWFRTVENECTFRFGHVLRRLPFNKCMTSLPFLVVQTDLSFRFRVSAAVLVVLPNRAQRVANKALREAKRVAKAKEEAEKKEAREVCRAERDELMELRAAKLVQVEDSDGNKRTMDLAEARRQWGQG